MGSTGHNSSSAKFNNDIGNIEKAFDKAKTAKSANSALQRAKNLLDRTKNADDKKRVQKLVDWMSDEIRKGFR